MNLSLSFSFLSSYYLVFLSLFLSALLLVGCLTKKSTDLGEFSGNPIDQSRLVNSVLSELQYRYDLTNTLRMQMKVSIEEKGKKEEVRETLWYKRSRTGQDQLHIQAMGFYNQPRAVMLANNTEFLLYLVNEQESIRAPLEDAVLQDIFGIDLRISDVKSSIFANPFLDRSTRGDFYIQPVILSDDHLRLSCKTSSQKLVEEIMILNYTEAPIVRSWKIFDPRGELVQETHFSDYREVDGILRPYRLLIKRPKEETKVEITTIKPEIGGEINDQKFDFERFPK